MLDTEPIPTGFWPQVNHQLDRIMGQRPDSFDAVRAILLDAAYDAIVHEVNRNGPQTFDENTAFFAGSGGEDTLWEALNGAGWNVVVRPELDWYVMAHQHTGQTLTYTEGDVERGDRIHQQLQTPDQMLTALGATREELLAKAQGHTMILPSDEEPR